MAAGMRKFQSERDALVTERDDWKSKYEDVYNNVIKPCDEALENDDIDTVFRLITGGKELNDLVEERGNERETLAKMTPQQLDTYNNQKQIEKRLMDLERREKLLQKREEETNAKLDTSDKHRQEAMVTPVFEKYRFAGKFGNADKEYMADSMLWNAAIAELSQYESVDRELIDKVFKKQSSVFNGLINAQANKKVDSKIKKQKQEVKREVQKEIFQKNNNRKQDIEQQVKDGDYKNAIAEIFSGNSIF
jgi:hypothetical protein